MTILLSSQLWWSLGTITTLCTIYTIKTRLDLAASRRLLAKSHGCLPPAERKRNPYYLGLDCLGFKDMKLPNIWEVIHDRCLSYNNTFHVSMLGYDVLETNEPENIKAILATQFKDFTLSWRQRALASFFGKKGIFVTDGELWHHSRALLRPQFTRDHVDDLPTFEVHVSRLLAALPDDGSTVDLEGYFFKLSLDATTEFLFGRSTNGLAPDQSEEDKLFADAINEALDGSGNPFRHGVWQTILPDRKWNRAVAYVRKTVDELVRQARQRHLANSSSGKNADLDAGTEDTSSLKPYSAAAAAAHAPESKRYNVLDSLIPSTDDDVLIRDNLINLLVAGRDTTATLLTNTFNMICRPEQAATLDHLRADIAETVIPTEDSTSDSSTEKPTPSPPPPPTYPQLLSLRHLQHTLSESLRLHPPVPSNARLASPTHDLILPTGGGPTGTSPILVPASTLVLWHIYSTHRRQDLWGSDADVFRPERWAERHSSNRPGWAYVPFNGGPRVCLGQKFALAQAGYVVVRVLQEFEGVEGRDADEWRPKMAGTLLSANGARVGLTRRRRSR